MYEKCIEMQQAIYGEEYADPDVITCVNNLRRICQHQGKLEDRV